MLRWQVKKIKLENTEEYIMISELDRTIKMSIL